MPDVVTNRFLFELFTGVFNFTSADIRGCFLRIGITPTKDTNVLSELAPWIEGPRFLIPGVTVTEDDAADMAYLDANDVETLPMSGPQTITWLVLYRQLGDDTVNTVIGAIDIPDILLNGSTISIVWPSPAVGGFLRLLQVAP